MPRGNVPRKGTVKREEMEHVLMEQLYVRRNDTTGDAETYEGNNLDDLDDQVRFWIILVDGKLV